MALAGELVNGARPSASRPPLASSRMPSMIGQIAPKPKVIMQMNSCSTPSPIWPV
jgi:hypothetical protein